MMGDGRPLRFLALLLGGWIAVRAIMLWPPAEAILEPMLEAVASTPVVAAIALRPEPVPVMRVSLPLPARVHRVSMAIRDDDGRAVSLQPESIASGPVRERPMEKPPQTIPPPDAPVGRAVSAAGSPWTVSAWLVARGNGDGALAPGGMLGGSQAGIRAAWRPENDLPVALFGRISRPLRTRGAEAAIGVEAQPFAAIPVRVAIEQRFALERGAAKGTALSLIGGVSDVALPGGGQLDAYGQAGVIDVRRRAGFIDGAVRAARPIATLGGVDVLLGAGVWGAAQPGLSRLDIGPRAELRLPVASRRVRLGVEWRERIAGNARPGSGPALTLGADF